MSTALSNALLACCRSEKGKLDAKEVQKRYQYLAKRDSQQHFWGTIRYATATKAGSPHIARYHLDLSNKLNKCKIAVQPTMVFCQVASQNVKTHKLQITGLDYFVLSHHNESPDHTVIHSVNKDIKGCYYRTRSACYSSNSNT